MSWGVLVGVGVRWIYQPFYVRPSNQPHLIFYQVGNVSVFRTTLSSPLNQINRHHPTSLPSNILFEIVYLFYIMGSQGFSKHGSGSARQHGLKPREAVPPTNQGGGRCSCNWVPLPIWAALSINVTVRMCMNGTTSVPKSVRHYECGEGSSTSFLV